MKRTVFALLLVLLSIPALAGEGVWTLVGPPPNREPDELVLDPHSPSTLYAVYGFGYDLSGLWKSTNGGRTWFPIQGALPTTYVRSLTPDPFTPGTLYLIANLNGAQTVQRSTDGGLTWTETYRDTTIAFDGLIADPVTPQSLWAFGYGGVYRSDDGGVTFPFHVSVTNYPADFAIDPLHPEILYLADSRDLWKSTDRGATWTAFGQFEHEGFEWFELAPSRPSTIYARPYLSYGKTPYCVRSDDGGLTWATLPLPGPSEMCANLVVDPDDHRKIWVISSEHRLYASSDSGSSWDEVHEDVPSTLSVLVMLRRDPVSGTIYTANERGGIFRSTDGGDTWQDARRGPAQAEVEAFLAIPGEGSAPLLLAGRRFTGLVRSRNFGRTWVEMPQLEFVTALAADPGDPSHLFAAGLASGTHILESHDRGATWTSVARLDLGLITRFAIHPYRPQVLYAGTQSVGIWKSLDGGRTWQSASFGLPFGPPCDRTFCPSDPVTELLINPRDPNMLWTVFSGKLLRSTNGGKGWARVQGPRGFAALSLDPRRPGTLYAIGDGNLQRSTDHGVTWTEFGRTLLARRQPRYLVDILADPRTGALYAASRFYGVFRSRDGGATWGAFSEGLPNLEIQGMELDPDAPGGLFVILRSGGIWSRR
ncbi:MAG TPA: hypothetical protein VMW27_22190 [Thermoanaerobaculia bacterium]|nr:hypothetical protein [Thermoanaerobaculia bacterium]